MHVAVSDGCGKVGWGAWRVLGGEDMGCAWGSSALGIGIKPQHVRKVTRETPILSFIPCERYGKTKTLLSPNNASGHS
jgi:hypothetical protein